MVLSTAHRRPGLGGALPWLPLVLLCGHFQSSAAAPSLSPVIIAPLKPVKSLHMGKPFNLSCQAHSPFPRMNLIYWLANGSFVEDRYPDRAVKEGDVRQGPRAPGVLLRRDLQFHAFSSKDQSTSFLCVARNPAGLDKVLVRWEPERPTQGSKPQQKTGQVRRTPESTRPVDRAERTG